MADQAGLLPGTLDLLILKAVSLGKLHGYGVLLRIEQISGGALLVQQGALYPALYRLEHQGLVTFKWGESENKRQAKYYALTAAGRRRLGEETAYWQRLSVRPGLTGFAQVRRGYETSMAEKLAHDLEWIADRSVRLYLRTLATTANRVLRQFLRGLVPGR